MVDWNDYQPVEKMSSQLESQCLMSSFFVFEKNAVGKIPARLEILVDQVMLDEVTSGWTIPINLNGLKISLFWIETVLFCCTMCPRSVFENEIILSKWNQVWPNLVSSIYFKGASRWLTYSKYIWNSLKTVHWTSTVYCFCKYFLRLTVRLNASYTVELQMISN